VGAVLSLGLIVDDAIVVTENIARFLREGHSRVEAAIEGTRQLAAAVIGSSLTLAFAFLPLLVLPGRSGMYLQSLPVAVIYMVAASLLVSLFVIPFLASRLLPRQEREGGGPALRVFVRAINRTYAPVLARALARPRTTVALCAALCVASFLLIPVVGFSLFPKAETPQFYISVTAPEGSSVEVTEEAVRHAERVVLAHPEVRGVFSSVGHDNPRVYYNVYPRRNDVRVGQLFVLLESYDPRATPLLLDSIRAELSRHPGARLELKEFENGPPVEAPIALRVVGPELETLRRLAGEVEEALRGTAGTRYVHNPLRLQRTDLRVSIDRAKAGMLGIPTLEVDRTLRMSLAGLEAGVLREADGEARPVVVRVSDQGAPGPEILDRVQVASLAGTLTPLRQIAGFAFETAAPEIERVDRERAVTVTGDVRTGYSTDRVSRAALAAAERIELPPGYRLMVSGEMQSRRESFGGIGNAIIVALFAVLAILVLEFGSFRGMLIVASVIPLGAMGGVLALLLTGNSLSFTATIGFAALIGIDVKTSILLVDFTNQLRRQGVALEEAIRRAGEARFLPIVLTSLTAIGALLPLALAGDALYSPLAWVIIGGLVSSTLLGRVLTPVLYWMLRPPVPGGVPHAEEPAAVSVVLPEIRRPAPSEPAGV
jgi:multidrug efflux pump subunit AcrB